MGVKQETMNRAHVVTKLVADLVEGTSMIHNRNSPLAQLVDTLRSEMAQFLICLADEGVDAQTTAEIIPITGRLSEIKHEAVNQRGLSFEEMKAAVRNELSRSLRFVFVYQFDLGKPPSCISQGQPGDDILSGIGMLETAKHFMLTDSIAGHPNHSF